jgi:tetratricopeptide (TPR) repeat protein
MFRFFTIITLVLLGGCASSPEKGSDVTVLSTKATELKREGRAGADKTSIEPDVMFMLLTAEIAGQRGQYDVALEGYMEAAKRVKDPRFAERAAMIAMYAKDAAKTDEAVALWLRDDPSNLAARKIAALSALKNEDKSAAVEHLSLLMKADPAGFEKTVMELTVAVQKQDKSAFVYDVLDELALQSPGHADVYFVQALLAAQMKNEKLAESKLEQALKIQPDWDKALILQAQLSAYSGDMVRANALLKNAVAKYPENEKIKKLFAQVLIKSEDYEAAGEVYQSLIATDPNDNDSQLAYGLVQMQLDRDEKAEDIFVRLVDKPEWRSQASFYLGKIEEKRGNKEKALMWFDKVTDAPLAFEASLSAISLLAKDRQFDEATSRLELAQARYPEQKQRMVLMQADLYNQQKQYQQAFDLLTEALGDQGEDKELLYTRALMAERIGRLDILESDLQKILAKNPDNPEALNALGYSLLDKSHRYIEAEKYLKRALELQPNEAVIMDSYGWLQFKLGDNQKALDYLQRAYDKKQEHEIAAHLIEVLWVLNRKDEARKLFYKAIKIAPEDEYLLDIRHRVLKGEL